MTYLELLDKSVEGEPSSLNYKLRADIKLVADELGEVGFDQLTFLREIRKYWEQVFEPQETWDTKVNSVEDYRWAPWSELTKDPPSAEIFEGAAKVYQLSRDRMLPPPSAYVGIFGMTGVGKSALWSTLALREDRTVRGMDEKYLDNPYLGPYYEKFVNFVKKLKEAKGINLVYDWQRFDPSSLGDLSDQYEKLIYLQALNQSWFANKKFQQGLEAAGTMLSPTEQDVLLEEDIVYFLVQAVLLKSCHINDYLNDSILRLNFLPPSIRRPIIVFPWASMSEVIKRIEKRGRPAELIQPPEYWKILYLAKIQLLEAMQQAGVSVIMVDVEKNDFRPEYEGGPVPRQRKELADTIWQAIEEAHARLYADF